MKDSIAAAMTPSRQLLGVGLAALLCLALVLAAACGSDPTATPEPTPAPPTATPEPPAPTAEPQTGSDSDSTEHDDGDSDAGEDHDSDSDGDKVEAPANGDSGSDGEHSGQSSASSSEGKTDGEGSTDADGSGADSTVSNVNPNGEGMAFDNSRNVALFGAEPLNAVTWTVGPTAGMGELVAEGTLEQGLTIFNPMVDGEGSGFSVFYKGHEESMVELLPDLGPTYVWDTFETVAPTEMEIEGASFKIRAYSPLFMDVGPGDLELRVYGYDQSGADVLLAVQDIEVK